MRTEGIIIGMGLFLLIQVYSFKSLKRLILTTCIFLVCFASLNKIQDIGSTKYYGKDYFFVSAMNPLCTMLNQSNVNVSYEGATEDLETMNAIVPLEWIRQSGVHGYRCYNHLQGRDINQTCATKEQSSKFLKAYSRFILHNKVNYVYCQWNSTLTSLGTSYPFEFDGYSGIQIQMPEDTYVDINNWWQAGAEELKEWSNYKVYTNTAIFPNISDFTEWYQNIWNTLKLAVVLRFTTVAFTIYIFI